MPSKKYYELYKTDELWKVKRQMETKKYREENKEMLAQKNKEYKEKKKR